jgi:eukaryotic-like serine/threonine-protein kinase
MNRAATRTRRWTDEEEFTLLGGAAISAPRPPATLCLLPGGRGSLRRAPVPTLPFDGWRRYRQVTLIGEGGMGRVYRAVDPRLGRTAALKFPRVQEGEGAERTFDEARLQARAESEHVPKIYEVGEFAGCPYFAMQHVDGPTLKAARREMTAAERLAVAIRLCRALDAVHDCGLVHRDVNPRNVVLRRSARAGWWPYLIDFGIAQESSRTGRRFDPRVMGTASYMAPEQTRGGGERIDRRTDVYSLGATLYELFSGRRPFAAEDSAAPALPTAAPALASRLSEILGRCLEKAPDDRFPTAGAVAAELESCEDGESCGLCYHSATPAIR